MKKSKKIIFFGTEDLSAQILQSLIENGYAIACVVTKPDSKKGRGQILSAPRVKALALKHRIPVLQPANLGDIVKDIKQIPDRLGVLVSFGRILPKEILELFEPYGIINLHPSLLPKYRGASPIESAILNGDHQTGISFIKLVESMDAGPIYDQIVIPLSNKTGAIELYQTVSKVGSDRLTQIIDGIINNKLSPSLQDDSKASYCNTISKSDGLIEWNDTADMIERKIRAYQIWPKSRTKIGDKDVVITKSEVVELQGEPGKVSIENKELIIYCKENAIKINRLLPAGKKEMSSEAFLAGYKID